MLPLIFFSLKVENVGECRKAHWVGAHYRITLYKCHWQKPTQSNSTFSTNGIFIRNQILRKKDKRKGRRESDKQNNEIIRKYTRNWGAKSQFDCIFVLSYGSVSYSFFVFLFFLHVLVLCSWRRHLGSKRWIVLRPCPVFFSLSEFKRVWGAKSQFDCTSVLSYGSASCSFLVSFFSLHVLVLLPLTKTSGVETLNCFASVSCLLQFKRI